MVSIGIICEYNPFHNGHVYHIKKIKELYPDSTIVLVMSGNYTQRGDVSVINKWDKTRIALNYVDLVVELPFVFATQGADIFAHGAIQILNSLNVDKLVFGSESNNVDELIRCAKIQLDEKYEELVKKYSNLGLNYPTASCRALSELGGNFVDNPNDILGLCYIKEIIKQNSSIEPISIKRTNNYHSKELSDISSASAIREAIKNDTDITNYVPIESLKYISKDCFIDKYYNLLKYKILTEDDLYKYESVDDKILFRIKKYIYKCSSFDELIEKLKTKRYTYNRIKRMLLHILCNFTKSENELCNDIHYIRILGFNEYGKKYLHGIKKNIDIPIITNFGSINDIMLDIELRSTCVYSSIFDNQDDIIKSEYKNKPIIK